MPVPLRPTLPTGARGGTTPQSERSGGCIGYPRGIDTSSAHDDTAASDEPRRRIRQLILSGDNLSKTRTDPVAAQRAGERFREARELAARHGLDDLVGIIDLRLQDLGPGYGDA